MDDSPPLTTVKVSKYRWVILVIFCLYSSINFVQFLQYSIIANITIKYYDVESIFVDLTGLIFMINFVIFCLPVNYLIERYNLKIIALFSSGVTTTGCLIKLASAARDRFYVVMIGQFLCAFAQVFMLSIPSKLASTWFGPEEVSTACAIAILGTQIGVAVGCIFPSSLVKNSDNLDNIGDDFFNMAIINASLTCATFLLVVLFFRARPNLPPSQSQVNIIQVEAPSLLSIIKSLFKSKTYILLLIAFGSCNGMYTTFGIIINGVYLKYFPDSESEIGIISASSIIAGGCFGSVIFGFILDKWHKFKLTSFFVMIASGISYIFVAITMEEGSKLGTYFTIPVFGFFIASTLLVGFEFVTEVMYPVPEAASCSVLNSVIYVFSILYTLIFEAFLDAIGYIPTHSIIAVLLMSSSLLLYFITPTLRRREANIRKTQESQ